MRDRTWMKPDRKWGTIRISRVRGDHKQDTLCEGKKMYFSIEEKKLKELEKNGICPCQNLAC